MSTATNNDLLVLFQHALDAAPNAVLIYQAVRDDSGAVVDFRCRYANEQATHWLGVAAGEFLNDHPPKRQADETFLFNHYRQAAATAQPVRFTIERSPDRNLPLRWFDVQVKPLADGIVCFFTDITEANRNEQQSLRTAAALQAVLDSTQAGVALHRPVYDQTGTIVNFEGVGINPAVRSLPSAATPNTQELLESGQFATDYFLLFKKEGLFAAFTNVIKTGRPQTYERYFRLEGVETWYEVTARCYPAAGSEERLLGLTVVDITHRKQAQQQLVEAGHVLQNVLNGAQAGIVHLKAIRESPAGGPPVGAITDFLVVLANDVAARLNGIPIGDLLGRTCGALFPYYKTVGLFERYVEVVQSGRPQRFEMPGYGGEPVEWFDVSLVQHDDGLIITFSDISVRHRTQQQLEQLTENLQAVLNSSPAAIAFLKAVRDSQQQITDFRLVVGNDQFARLCGEPLPVLLGASYRRLAQVLWQEETFEGLLHVFATGEARYEEQLLPGTERWLGLAASRQDGGVILTSLDITDLKQTQQQREALRGQVEQSAETVEQLADLRRQMHIRGDRLRTSSHDLRASLGIIQGASQLLTYVHTDEERGQMLDMLRRNVGELSRLITELLDYTRLEAGYSSMVVAPFDAGELLTKLADNVQPLIAPKGLSWQVEGPLSLPVEGDAVRVLRMAQQLVLNALKYTTVGHIALHWQNSPPGEWGFSVIDTGPGMPAELAGQLAYPAAEVDEPLRSSASGDSTGLPMVRHFCERLRGRLTVESGPSGTAFNVTLPSRY